MLVWRESRSSRLQTVSLGEVRQGLLCDIMNWKDTADRLVGVVGSGRGITQYDRMGKHKFEEGQEE